MKIKMEISNLNQTHALAEAFSKVLKAPMIVLLKGDLGSGKTTFVKDVVSILGSKDLVTSPIFTLLNTYKTPNFNVYHFDMYRLTSTEEALNVGFAEYFDKKTLDGVCFVEWPENVDGLIKDVDFVVEITKKGEHHRIIVIKEGGK